MQDPAIFGNAQSAAERMMAKMGWQAGQGLGQKGQGMTTPLEHRRSKQGGAAMIVNAEERAAAAAVRPAFVWLRCVKCWSQQA